MSIIDWLIPRGKQPLLASLLIHPERSFSVRELIKLTGSSAGGQNTISQMVTAGVALEEKVGNQRRLRANPKYPLYTELRAIVTKTFGVADLVRQALNPFRDGLRRAFIFGSLASGTDRADSDIDLMLVGEIGVDVYVDLSNAMHALGDEIGRPVHFHLYGEEEWRDLLDKDNVIGAIANGPKIEIEVSHGT
jgi:uncharacterized protein